MIARLTDRLVIAKFSTKLKHQLLVRALTILRPLLFLPLECSMRLCTQKSGHVIEVLKKKLRIHTALFYTSMATFLMFAKVLKCCTRQTSSRCLCRLLHPSAACLFTCLPVRTDSHLSHHHYMLQDAHVSLMVLVGVCGRWVLMLCQGT